MGEHDSAAVHADSYDEHSHRHGTGETSSRKLAAVSIINLLGFGAELAGGLRFGSVALLSDAFHMLFDALAYVMAFRAAAVGDGFWVTLLYYQWRAIGPVWPVSPDAMRQYPLADRQRALEWVQSGQERSGR